MNDSGTFRETSPILTELPRFEGPIETGAAWRSAPQPWNIPRLNLVLFLLTLLSTTMAGADTAGAPVTLRAPLQSLLDLPAGLPFSIPLMSILLAHEMGHYLTSRRYGVDATLPYFIPAPFPSIFFVGTFGAFIRIKSPVRTRRAMFDIGAAGPWAGFAVAILAIVIGLKLSTVRPLDNSSGGIELGNSMLFWAVSRVVLGVDPNTVNVDLSPIAFAGWIGLLVTTINLLPVGQLDGGHTIYALFGGRWHRIISRLTWLGTALMVVVPYALGFDFWAGWLVWFGLVFVLGLGHPSTADADTPLSGPRRWMAWATVALFIVTFPPVPVSLVPPSASQQQQQQPQEPSSGGQGINVMHHGATHSADSRGLHQVTLRF
jgi:membrane-associated protease RseP (regulator of RpoE activity)